MKEVPKKTLRESHLFPFFCFFFKRLPDSLKLKKEKIEKEKGCQENTRKGILFIFFHLIIPA